MCLLASLPVTHQKGNLPTSQHPTRLEKDCTIEARGRKRQRICLLHMGMKGQVPTSVPAWKSGRCISISAVPLLPPCTTAKPETGTLHRGSVTVNVTVLRKNHEPHSSFLGEWKPLGWWRLHRGSHFLSSSPAPWTPRLKYKTAIDSCCFAVLPNKIFVKL